MKKTQRNNFVQCLKTTTPNIQETSANDAFLKKLGLVNIPENINISISDDGKYINFQLNDKNIKKPILFQLPIETNNLDAYLKHPQFVELSDRYEYYSTEYKDKIKDYSSQERKFLQEQFPDMVFNIKVRMKSKSSYEEKENQCILSNESPFINDIIAERIIISEFNGSRDPKVLEEACYTIAKALYDFRINTDFRMKENFNISVHSAKTDKEFISKDYIANPKENGYKSLHILTEDKTNPDCCYETQIRTFYMEEQSKNDDQMSHSKRYKPRLLNDLSVLKVPKYSEVTNFSDITGNPIVIDVPTKLSFYHYYGISIENYRQQLSIIENFIPLKTVRERLINYKNNLNVEKVQ